MLQDGVPGLYRKPSLRPERAERRAREENDGSSNNIGDHPPMRGILEIEPVSGKDKDPGPSSLLHRRTPSIKSGGEAYRLLYVSACSVAFVNAMTFSVLGPFLPAYIADRFGSTSTQVGMIMAAYPAVNLAASPLVGWVMNRYGRWKSLFAGLLLLTVATALYGLASSVPWLYIASGLHGASLSFIHVSSLGLLSAYPDRLTESMAGIEIWSGVAEILGPPLGCLAVPYGGVSSIFLVVAVFPVVLLLFTPRVRHLLRSGKASEGGFGDINPAGGKLAFWKVARNRGVLTGAFVTAYNYAVIGFLEVTLAPHLAQTLSTSPRSIGFVLVLPNVLYTLTAMKAEDIVDRQGARRTLLAGLCIMSMSLLMSGPSPALAPALVTRGAARGAICAGLLAFQVGSALASVPAFTAMQGGVAGMGTGADDMVASAHAMSIGVGEVIGPMIGGFVVELLPTSPAFACEPDVPIVQLHDPIFQLAGELRPHLSSSSSSGGGGGGGEQGQEEVSEEAEEVYFPEISSADIAADARQGEDFGSADTKDGEDVVWITGQEENGKSRLLKLYDGEEQGRERGRGEEEDWIAVEFREGGATAGRLLGEDGHENEGVSRMLLLADDDEEEEEERARGKLRQGHPDDASSTRSTSKPAEAAERRSDAGGRDGERKLGQQQQQQQREGRALVERGRGRRARRGRHRVRAKRENAAAAAAGGVDLVDARDRLPSGAAAVTSSKGGEEEKEGEEGEGRAGRAAAAGVDGAGGLGGPRGGAGLPLEMGSGENDVEYLPVVGEALTGAAAAAAAEGAAQSVDAVDGLGDGGGAGSCDSAFPLATTLLAWASGFAVLAMYRLLPSPAGGGGGGGGVGGGGGKAAHGVVVLPA